MCYVLMIIVIVMYFFQCFFTPSITIIRIKETVEIVSVNVNGLYNNHQLTTRRDLD